MLAQGIISESSSPWMAPTVFVPKKLGELRICIDYRQDHLTRSSVLITLDLQSVYWQLPLAPDDQAKTAFCPGPGMGLYQFHRMPFGLTGAPGSFQHLMDTVLRGLSFVTTYIDDVLIFFCHSRTTCQPFTASFPTGRVNALWYQMPHWGTKGMLPRPHF